MILFLFTFFLLYGLFHLYAFLKTKAALALGTYASICLALVMIVMIFAPLIVRMSEKVGFDFFGRLMSYIGYTWMGVLFLFVSVSLVVDFYRLTTHLAEIILKRDLSNLAISSQYAFFIPILFSCLIAVYGYFEARSIRTERLIIKSNKIPQASGIRIVQISDVHLGLIVREDRLKRILREVQKAEPDIMVSTGDLVDGQIDNLGGLAELLREIRPRYGKFAITGNHEFYAGISQALDFTKKSGFNILRGEGLNVAGINIVGVDDPQGKTYDNFKDIPERELLSGFSRQDFTLFLKHRPLVDKGAIGLFDLQLSGHVHKGQIFPFSLITGLYYPIQAGFANLSNNSNLYVSRGSGTWGPPIRFLAPPEVTVIELVHLE
ncbi:MAG: metallophosphoesterase [Nitrospirota bacterium]